MNKPNAYESWETLILHWFQGTTTTPELIQATSPYLDIATEGWPDINIVTSFESALRKFNEGYYHRWEDRKERAKDTAPTVNGLVHNLMEAIEGRQTHVNLLEWASWHNMDGGETTSGVFENDRIEYFCLDFLPQFHENLDTEYFKRVLEIIKGSDRLTRSAFICSLFILYHKERTGMAYVLNDYVKGNRNDADLDKYFLKKFGFDTSDLPWMNAVRAARESGNLDLSLVTLVADAGL